MQLILGPLDTGIADPIGLLERFLGDPNETGVDYLTHAPISPAIRVLPEDLAVTLLVNSNAEARTFRSIAQHAGEVDGALSALSDVPLEESSPELRSAVVDLVSRMASWPLLQVSVTTKLLHKKRPALIPVLDNRAIFGALLWSAWSPPERKSKADSVHGREVGRIAAALDAIYRDLGRDENEATWLHLDEIARERFGLQPTRIELFDMVWWRYFRDCEPPGGASREKATMPVVNDGGRP